jgi:predicted permease
MSIERWWYVFPLRLRSLFRRGAVEQELDDELRYHVERQIEVNLARGMTPAAARTAALRAMGGLEVRKDECRDYRGVAIVDHTLRDLRHAVRLLKRSPAFTAVAVCSLAVGIGANAALFHLIERVHLRTLDVRNPHELAEVKVAGDRNFGISDGFNSEITYPLWEQIRDHQQAFNGVFAWGRFNPLVGMGADAQRASALWASGDFFSVLGIVPERGRLVMSSDDRRGCGAGPIVVSHAFWQRYFGGRDSAVGSRLPILNQTFTVVGVTPPDFTGLEVGRTFDVVVPVCAAGLWGDALDQKRDWWLAVMGRLKPGWTVEKASDHVRTLSPSFFDATVPSGYSAESTARYRTFRLGVWSVARGVSVVRADYGRALWLLFGMTGVVLLITCGNLATLMLARARAREQEIGVRVALGASRTRIVSQLSIESLLVAVMGALLSVPVALAAGRGLVTFLSTNSNPIYLELTSDWRVASFAAALALCTALLFGLAPALRSTLSEPLGALRRTSRSVAGADGRSLFQRVLVVGQVALSLVLVASALIFGLSVWNLATVKTGFQQDNLLAIQLLDLQSRYLPLIQRVSFQQVLTDEIGSTPGVVTAASSTHTPLNGASWSQAFRLANEERRLSSKFAYVGPEYFDTMRIPLIAGRGIRPSDTSASQRVIVVNEAFLRAHVGKGSALGRTLRTFAEPSYPETTYEIVGVVGDTTYATLRGGAPPIAFVPIAQHPNPRPWATVLARIDGPGASVTTGIKERIAKLNPAITVQVGELRGQIRELLTGDLLLAWLAGTMSALATTLAAVGLYGLVAYLATQRRKEIGIRLSLGSTRGSVVGLMMRESGWLVGFGVACGLPLAWLAMRGAAALVFGVSSDAQLPALAALLLAVVAAVSAGIPAWRASRLDPVSILRTD